MTKVLLLGGTGFIGEQLLKRLREAGVEVAAPTQSELDISKDGEKLTALLSEYDTLAVLTTPNEAGIKNVAHAIALTQPKHVLYTSTSLLYQSSKEANKETDPLAPQGAYELAKFPEEAELLRSNVPLTIARLGNVYGGPKNKGIVQKALDAMITDRPLVVSGLSQLRDFIHVDDAAAALAMLLVEEPQGVVNVSTGVGTSIREMLDELQKIAGKTLKEDKGEEGRIHKDMVADNSKLINLGFTPTISLTEGLKKTVDACKTSSQIK